MDDLTTTDRRTEPERRKQGRPPMPPDRRRTEFVGVRFRRDELESLYAVSRMKRMDAGEFLRNLFLDLLVPHKSASRASDLQR